MNPRQSIYFFAVLCFLEVTSGTLLLRNSSRAQYFNPVLDQRWPDPYAYLHTDGFYYMARVEDPGTARYDGLALYRSRKLTDWRNSERNLVFTAGPGQGAVWAPEIHFIDGQFYIYVAIETDGANINHRMYVIKCNNPSNPMGGWSTAYRMVPPGDDFWAIDGTVLRYGNGRNYFIWSGWPQIDSGFPQNLYIAALCPNEPMRICSERVLIKNIDWAWESHGERVIEGPQILKNAGRTFLIYSASGSWTPDYQLGMMGIDDLKDPLNYDNWWRLDRPVFHRNDEEGVYGTGHASFTTSIGRKTDGSEPWIVYHAMAHPDAGWDGRTARVQKFSWNTDGSPNFPAAVGFGTPLEGPSGEFHTT